MLLDVQPLCISCCNGWHDRHFPGHSYAHDDARNYHSSVEKKGYFKKDQRAINILNCLADKGLFSFLPTEMIKKIESYLGKFSFSESGQLLDRQVV